MHIKCSTALGTRALLDLAVCHEFEPFSSLHHKGE
jgi:hypothetical protein